MDDHISRLIQQDKLCNENESKRLDLEERCLALQEKHFEQDAEQRRGTTELLKMLVLNVKK